MSYITRDDLLPYLRDEHIENIASWQEFEIAIAVGMRRVRNELATLYEIEQEFLKKGEDREPLIVDCCVSIALFKIFKRLPERKGSNDARLDYTETIQLLERIGKGETTVQIPRRILANNEEANISTYNIVIKRRN